MEYFKTQLRLICVVQLKLSFKVKHQKNGKGKE